MKAAQDIIIKPIITERSMDLLQAGKYTFKVDKRCNKIEIAKAVEGQGADSVSLVNTFLGMAIDAEKRIPLLSTVTGGLSGPAIKPIALRMVWQVYNAVKIPVIGMGGIMNATDAIEFMLAGASAVQVGTAIFKDPFIPVKIVDGIENYLERHKLNSVSEIVGALQI